MWEKIINLIYGLIHVVHAETDVLTSKWLVNDKDKWTEVKV